VGEGSEEGERGTETDRELPDAAGVNPGSKKKNETFAKEGTRGDSLPSDGAIQLKRGVEEPKAGPVLVTSVVCREWQIYEPGCLSGKEGQKLKKGNKRAARERPLPVKPPISKCLSDKEGWEH